MNLLSFVTLSTLAASALAASADDWHSRSIYQLVVDRFAQTDGSSPKCDTSDRVYCGGTWQGVINKLDYIQTLGFDAIWISPVVTQINGTTPYGEAFHGYWPGDLTTLNSHFGSPSDLKSLADALHKRSMYLMIDVVVNHMAATAIPPNLTYNSFVPYDNSTSFHPFCFIQDYNNQTDVEQCWLGDTNLSLPDIDTEDQNIVDFAYNWIANLVKDNDVDGVRIDTVKHIRQDFWPGFNQSAGVFTIGEILHNDTDYVAPYTKVLGGALDYPGWYTLVQAFQTPFGNLSLLAQTAQETQSKYENGAFNTGSFLENHDQPRFQSLTSDQALVKNAMAWPFVTDGIPILYYGQEQGYAGGPDPANREALWLSGYNENNELVQHVQSLNAARKAAATISSSFHSTAMKVLSASGATMAISKGPLLTLLTNGGNTSSPSWSVPDAGYAANEVLTDVLTCDTLTADGNGGVNVNGTGGAPHVLLPTSALGGSGLCGNKASTGTPKSGSSIMKAPQLVLYSASLVVAGLLALTF